ncbi:MAG: hypothetical protein JW808_05595, partial [Victivallales bacterium]|nr:hypothetical protein [Victivallales bacterium]
MSTQKTYATGSASTVYYSDGAGKIGKVQSVTDAYGAITSFDYDSTTGRRIKVTNALNKDT